MNQDAQIGHNRPPDYAKEVTDRMARDYAWTEASTLELLAEARAMPEVVTEENLGSVAAVIVKLRDLVNKLGALRVAEKEPYLRSGEAVDQYFFGKIDRLARRQKTSKSGAADVLQARIDRYVAEKDAAERRERAEAERKARAEAEAKRRAQEEADRAAREAAEKAARARNPERKQELRDEAAKLEMEARARASDADLAREEHSVRSSEANAKTADLVRTRTDEGALVTGRQVPYAEVDDYGLLDGEALWPFVDERAKLKALEKWADVTQHARQMPGARIGFRSKGQVR